MPVLNNKLIYDISSYITYLLNIICHIIIYAGILYRLFNEGYMPINIILINNIYYNIYKPLNNKCHYIL